MRKHWIINTITKKYVETTGENWEGDWKLRHSHVKNFAYLDITTVSVWEEDKTANGIYYCYDLCANGGMFGLYVDVTKHTAEDIKAAKGELRRDRDVVSLQVYKLKPYITPGIAKAVTRKEEQI